MIKTRRMAHIGNVRGWVAWPLLMLVMGLLAWSGWKMRQDQKIKAAEVSRWPVVEAVLTRSEIREVNTSDDVDFSSRLFAELTFVYEWQGNEYESGYVQHWTRQDQQDWSQLLRPDQAMNIRINPDDPSEVSLYDLNGVP